ncbi:MAG: ATP-binding protein [Sporichthyaceae bacterium]|nr:ATP-binding protein [Sporichthyaceae bacterium]
MLILLSGVPATGKSAVADELSRVLPAPVFSVDPIESAILGAGLEQSYVTGLAAYGVAQNLVDTHLALGHTVIADAVNSAEEARAVWRDIADTRGVRLKVVQCVCSDERLHRDRLQARRRNLPPQFPEPTWSDIQRQRDKFVPWLDDHLVIDSVRPLADNVGRVLRYIGRPERS